MQRFFGSISTICLSAGDEAQQCRVNWTKTGPQHRPVSLPAVTSIFPNYKLHSRPTGLYARIHKAGFEKEMEK